MNYLHDNKEAMVETLNYVADKTNFNPTIIEKDYYVTLILRRLKDALPYVVFKGGTSLSKCHKAIRRFSEDIDISVDTSISQNEKRKVKAALKEIVHELGLVIPNLAETRSRRDFNRYEIAYESYIVPDEDEIVVGPKIILEISYTTTAYPTVHLEVSNIIRDAVKDVDPRFVIDYNLESFVMKVQSLERTLVDKIFALCDYYINGQIDRHSRHIYDIYKLLPKVKLDVSFKKLIEEARTARAKSAICVSAKAGTSVTELLNRIIVEETYRSDYGFSTVGILEESLSYDDCITAVQYIADSKIFG